MQFNEIIVLGAGALGSFYGAMLSSKNNVLLVGRKEHIKKINQKGLELTGSLSMSIKVRATERIVKINPSTLIILTTKVIDSEKAVQSISHLLLPDTVILVLQNGLNSEEIVKKIVSCEVIRGISMTGIAFLRPGTIAVSQVHSILINESSSSNEIEKLFKKSDLKCEIVSDFKQKEWEKLIVNCMLNPLGALMEVKNKSIVNNLPLTTKLIFNECKNVAEKEGIKLGEDFFQKTVEGLKDSKNFSSMFQDIIKGRKTEIDFLNAEIVKTGEKHGIPTPINKMLVELIKFKEQNEG